MNFEWQNCHFVKSTIPALQTDLQRWNHPWTMAHCQNNIHPQKGTKSNVENYRPVASLHSATKIFVRLILNNWQWHELPAIFISYLYTPFVMMIMETTFVPGSVSVSKIKRQWCKVVPKRVPDILKSVFFVSGYLKCRLFFVLPENNRLGTIGNEISWRNVICNVCVFMAEI